MYTYSYSGSPVYLLHLMFSWRSENKVFAHKHAVLTFISRPLSLCMKPWTNAIEFMFQQNCSSCLIMLCQCPQANYIVVKAFYCHISNPQLCALYQAHGWKFLLLYNGGWICYWFKGLWLVDRWSHEIYYCGGFVFL